MTSTTVAKELAMKFKLEARVKPKLKKLFRQISQDVKVIWLTTSTIPNLNSFHVELTAILREHYREVAKRFKKVAFDSLIASIDTSTKKQFVDYMPNGFDSLGNTSYLGDTSNQQEDNSDKLALLLLLFINMADRDIISFVNRYSEQQASSILQTTQGQLQYLISVILSDAAAEGIILTHNEEAVTLEQEFNGRSDNRIDTIAATETQTPAEMSKLLVALALAAIIEAPSGTNGTFPSGTVVKIWNSIIDKVTRDSHLSANGQTVRVDEPFTVGGQQLASPGDSSLGATIKNIANCRCVATYKTLS